MSIEEQLNRFERWQESLHKAHQVKGSMQSYCNVSLSDQGLRNWMKRTHLNFPFLPWQEQDEQGRLQLQCVIWARWPFPITWAGASLYRVLGDLHRVARPEPRKIDPEHWAQSREDVFLPEGDDLVNGRSCAELLYGLDKPTRQQYQFLKRLRSDPNCWQGHASRLLRRADGGLIPIDVCVTYTGDIHEKFFWSAVVTGPVRWPPKPKIKQRFACEQCHDLGLVPRELPVNDPNFGRAVPCPACQQQPDTQAHINTTGEVVYLAKTFPPFTFTDKGLLVSAYNPTSLFVNNPQSSHFVFNSLPPTQFVLTPTPTITVNHDRSHIVLETDTGMTLKRAPAEPSDKDEN